MILNMFILFCSHYESYLHNSSFKTEILYPVNSSSPFPPPSQPLATTILLFVCDFDCSEVRHISGIIQYLSFWDWLISLCIMSSGFILVVVYVRISFLFVGWGGCTCNMRKFPGQGSNLCHSCNQSYSSDSAGSLTCWAPRELQNFLPF